MRIELFLLPLLVFLIPLIIYFYKTMNTKLKKSAFILGIIFVPLWYHFYYNVYINNLSKQELNVENQRKLERYLIYFKYTPITHPQFFYPAKRNPTLRDLKNKKNQEHIKELYIKYLNNDGKIIYKEVSIISFEIAKLATYEK